MRFSVQNRMMIFSALLLFLAIGTAGCDDKNAQNRTMIPEVSLITVLPQNVSLTVEAEGRVTACQIADVRPQVNGILQKRLFEEGADVKEGDVLYRIDPLLREAELASAKASLIRARAQARPLQLRYERNRKLLSRNAVSRQEYDDSEAAYKQALAEIGVAEAAVKTARIYLDYTEVKAPISGRTGRSMLTPGALMTANQADLLTTVTQLDPIYVDMTQSSVSLLNLEKAVREGSLSRSGDNLASVQLKLENGDAYESEGRLTFTGTRVDEATGTISLRAVFANPDRRLLPGMYVRAILRAGERKEALLVPHIAVQRDPNGKAFLYMLTPDNTVYPRFVTMGPMVEQGWIVEDGLKAGESVVVKGLQMIRPGLKVSVRENAAPQNTGEGKGA
ncbi:MAG: efflux RND transporter periplasmic adaptor subunit [Desulfovibrionaceae bacterium]|nr:efflux RND transporter periplasmic adaptor subunit [Desulfovibrionaceae bacterium]